MSQENKSNDKKTDTQVRDLEPQKDAKGGGKGLQSKQANIGGGSGGGAGKTGGAGGKHGH